MSIQTTSSQRIALFEWKEVRKVWHNNEWRFSIIDIIDLLNVSGREARKYRSDLKNKLIEEWATEVSEKIGQLKLLAPDGKMRFTDCADTQTCLRIIQSIPSPRAEPFKQWLAQVWYERIQEINDPELSMQRMIATYEKKWYPKEWIDIRTRGMPVRKWLTKERDERWWDQAYGVLTNEIYKAYTGMDNKDRMNHKGMKSWNLRDGMSPTELILTMLAEQATTDITKARDATWIKQLKVSAKDGWWVALKARQELMDQTGKDPITDSNYLAEIKGETKMITKKKPKKK